MRLRRPTFPLPAPHFPSGSGSYPLPALWRMAAAAAAEPKKKTRMMMRPFLRLLRMFLLSLRSRSLSLATFFEASLTRIDSAAENAEKAVGCQKQRCRNNVQCEGGEKTVVVVLDSVARTVFNSFHQQVSRAAAAP